ncbi:methylated-DNA--[protein]-cysteine S-methyltransferase [Paraflavisolibacter sp. H34]|uniref:methylated-DNA--[protein]-cysteine S-methyltransferase n=1 Tax=Huijunlia imazamoxiresistens TaxID=3127457 RepID=UPI00301A79EF
MRENLSYTYYASPAGWLQLEATDDFITALSFIDDGEATAAVAAAPVPPGSVLNQCRTQLDEYFAGKRKAFDFPFRQEGTAFQQQVWNLLTAIPYGRTLSYLELARQFGNTKAIRAVGTANGRNRLAIVVPCHRVIGSNQKLVGYAGGLARKKWLLDHEARFLGGVQELGF